MTAGATGPSEAHLLDRAPQTASTHMPLVGPRIGRRAGPQAGLDRVITCLLILIALLPALLMTRGYLTEMSRPGDPVEPFSDAITYLAAGERLNAGHPLYRLSPGDRPVLILPQTFNSPLVSPPPIAVLWRPLAALPFGLLLWVVAAWACLLGAIVVGVLRCGLPATILSVALFDGIAQQLSVANVAAFFPGLLILAWYQRARPASAAVIGLMAAVKIAPGTMFGWLVGRRGWRQVGFAASGLAVLAVVGVIGAGIPAWLDYLEVARETRPSPGSLSGVTGLPWLSFAVLITGTLVAAVVRRDGWSFTIGVVASVLGTPALYHAGFVPLLAILAPLGEHLSARQTGPDRARSGA